MLLGDREFCGCAPVGFPDAKSAPSGSKHLATWLLEPTSSRLRSKMLEYQGYGVRLGWLINPQDRQVEIYRLGREVQVLLSSTAIGGEDILPGFMLDLQKIW